MIRVMLTDDHAIFRQALRVLLDREVDMQVVAEAGDAEMALRLAKEFSPNVVVMDVGISGLNGIETTRRLLADNAGIKVLALSTHFDRHIIQQMLDAGAAGYVVKSSAGAELLQGIRAVFEGRSYLCPSATTLVVGSLREQLPAGESDSEPLSRRELQVVSLIAEGKTSPEIADALHISPHTVEVHRRNITRKLKLRSVAELTKYAIRKGLTSA